MKFSLVHEEAGFQVYRAATKIAIYENGEFFVQYFKAAAPREYRDPAYAIASIFAVRAEAEADAAEARAARLADVKAYLAKRAARACHLQLELFA